MEHNVRVRHVFVHGNGRIEALGSVSGEGGDDEEDDDAIIDTVLVVNVANQTESKRSNGGSTGGGGNGPLNLAPLPKRSMLTPGNDNNNNSSNNNGSEQQERPKFYTHRQEKERLDDIDAMQATKRGQKQLNTPLQVKIRDLEKNLGPSANGPPETDAVAEINSIVEAEKWSQRANNMEQEHGLTAVPDDYMGTETAPAAYASPLTRRIRALEERLAIADMGEDGVSAPMPASEVVAGIAGHHPNALDGDGGSALSTSFSSQSKSGVRKNGQTPNNRNNRNNRNGNNAHQQNHQKDSNKPPQHQQQRAKSALGRSRQRGGNTGNNSNNGNSSNEENGGNDGQQSQNGMPSPAWQGNSGPSLLGNALAQKEGSINQDASRNSNRQKAAKHQRDRPVTTNNPSVSRSMSVRRAGAASVIRGQKKEQENYEQEEKNNTRLARRDSMRQSGGGGGKRNRK